MAAIQNTLGAVIKEYPIKNIYKNVVLVLFLSHVILQVGVKQLTPKSITGIKRENLTRDIESRPRSRSRTYHQSLHLLNAQISGILAAMQKLTSSLCIYHPWPNHQSRA